MKKTTTTTTTTTTGNKTLKTVGGIVLAIGIGYLLYNLLKRRPTSIRAGVTDLGQTIKNAPQEVRAVVTGKYQECGFPLQKGCGGDNVKKLQRWLNETGSYGLAVDGKFGDLTENAVIDNQMPFNAFQSMHPQAIKGKVSQEFFNAYIKNA